MDKKKIFISSVQSEFVDERRALVAYIRQDAMLGRYFEPCIFEELPAQDCSAHPVYLAGYIEQIGTGTTDLIDRCVAQGLARPMFVQDDDFLLTLYRHTPQVTPQDTAQVTAQDKSLNNSEIDNSTMQDTAQVTAQDTPQDTPQVTPQVIRVLRVLGEEERSKQEIMEVLVLSDTKNFKEMYLQPALQSGLIEMTIPDKPTSRNQKYRKTQLGKEIQL